MPGYPTMDQYNDAVQHPGTAFSDAALKSAKIATNGMGLPVALGGGFALTYSATAQGRKYAVRCFHKEVKGLESRYAHIDKALRAAGGKYFVGFEFQSAGVQVNGQRFPIVKMDWVEGETLGSFLEDNYTDKSRIEQLRTQFLELEKFLRSRNIAHGDIQNGNVLVRTNLTLIDYDGVYVPSLTTGQGTELGHKHFQHPKRSAADFGPNVDRFSFIVVDLSLRAIGQNSKLFAKYSNGENILFTANDFLDPRNSPTFGDLKALPALAKDATNLAAICLASVGSVPTLEDFLAGRNIPAAQIVVRQPTAARASPIQAAYVGAFDVVDASKFPLVARQVGNKVELVGQVTKVHFAKTKYGKPYAFVFFDHSKQGVKLNIWSEGLAKLASKPSNAWTGKWLSVQGLVDPPYTSYKYGTSLSITITANNQLRHLTETEARHRLGGTGTRQSQGTRGNREILEDLIATPTRGSKSTVTPAPRPATPLLSRNQAILDSISPGQGSKQGQKPSPISIIATASTAPPQPTPKPGVPWGWIVFGGIMAIMMLRSCA